jgi:hypothetical protein
MLWCFTYTNLTRTKLLQKILSEKTTLQVHPSLYCQELVSRVLGCHCLEGHPGMAYLVESFSLVSHQLFGWDDELCQEFISVFN